MKHSAQLFVFLFIAFPLFISCDFSNRTAIYGNYQLVNQRIEIGDYDKVILNVPAEVFYQQFSDSTPYLQIHTDENIFRALDVRVQDNQLIIDVKKDSVIKPTQFTIYTASSNLNRVSVAGAGKIRLKGEVNAEDFNLDIAGSGNFLSDSLICDKLTASIVGSGNAQLTGASNSSSFKITGTGSIQAFSYLVQESDCHILGSGNIETWVTNKLDVNITGSGNLTYRGNPKSINNNTLGSGKVKSVE